MAKSTKKTKSVRSAELDLLESIDRLTRKINELIDLFSAANMQMEQQDIDTELISKLNNVVEQNEKIAEGILAVADMAKDIKEIIEKNEKEEDYMFDKVLKKEEELLTNQKPFERPSYPGYPPEQPPVETQIPYPQPQYPQQEQGNNLDFPKPQQRPSINPFESNILNEDNHIQQNPQPQPVQTGTANNMFQQEPKLPPKISDDVLGMNPIQQNTAPKPLSFGENKEKNDKNIFS